MSEPLNSDGTVNYLAALNNEYSKGVTPENNAAVLLLRAFGPGELPVGLRDQFLTQLGTPQLSDQDQYFVDFETYKKTRGVKEAVERYPKMPFPGMAPAKREKTDLEKSMEKPWGEKDYPILAAWLKANQKPLSLVIAASKRPRYYIPMVPPDEPPLMINCYVPFGYLGQASGALVSRAMLRLNSGDIGGARSDLLAVHRLARLLRQSSHLIQCLVAGGMESRACLGDNAVAISGRLTGDQAQDRLSELQGLPALPNIVEAIDKSERFYALDAVMFCYREGYENFQHLVSGEDRQKPREISKAWIDWNEVLRMINSRYDLLVEAHNKATLIERQRVLEHIYAERTEMMTEYAERIATSGEEAALLSPKTTRDMSIQLICDLVSHTEMAGLQIDLARMRLETSKVAIALAAYRVEQGSYPDNLSELCPKYFKTVPEDFFTAKPLDYRRVEKGYILYSPGPTDYEKFKDYPLDIEISVAE